jgi:hypothetical protein
LFVSLPIVAHVKSQHVIFADNASVPSASFVMTVDLKSALCHLLYKTGAA